MDDWDEIHPLEFEGRCAATLTMLGWSAQTTKGSGDQGVDVIAEKAGVRLVLQCKKYSTPVGNWAVQEIYAGQAHYKADHAAVVTNSSYTPQAKELAQSCDVKLLHITELLQIDALLPQGSNLKSQGRRPLDTYRDPWRAYETIPNVAPLTSAEGIAGFAFSRGREPVAWPSFAECQKPIERQSNEIECAPSFESRVNAPVAADGIVCGSNNASARGSKVNLPVGMIRVVLIDLAACAVILWAAHTITDFLMVGTAIRDGHDPEFIRPIAKFLGYSLGVLLSASYLLMGLPRLTFKAQ